MSTTALQKTTDLDLAVAEAAQAYEVATADKTANIASALAAADAIDSLRKMFTPPIVAKLRQLCGKSLGFTTDRDQKGPPYPDNVIVECALEAGLRGLPFVANAFMIVNGKVYVSKNGLKILIRRIPDVSNFTYTVGLPKRVGDGIVSDCSASWTQATVKRELALQIPMRLDGASIDNLLGRIERRLLARTYEQMSQRVVAEDLDLEPETAALATTAPKFLTVGETAAPAEDPLADSKREGSAQRALAAVAEGIAQAIAPAPQPPPAPAPTPAPAPKPPVVHTEIVPPTPAAPAPRRGPGRPPKAKPTLVEAPLDEPPPEDEPPAPAPAPAPRQPDLSSLGAQRVERPQALTLPQIRQVLADVDVAEQEVLGFLAKRHGLGPDIGSLEQLALMRQPLFRHIAEHTQTVIEQVLAARA